MKRTAAIIFSLFIATFTNNAQSFRWAKSFGGSSWDSGTSIAVDASGNVYTTGFFNGTVDFDPGAGTANRTSMGDGDVFVQKLDASGNFLWVKTFGGLLGDIGNSITVDTLGNVYTTGRFGWIVDFDPGAGIANLISSGNLDVFVQKLDANGNFLWAKSFGSSGWDYGHSITIDVLGNVYTTGSFEGTVDFNPGVGTANRTSVGGWDIFVQKLDANGNFLWAQTFGGSLYEEGRSITVDASGNVYTTGAFEGTVDFNPGVGTVNFTSAGFDDIFIQKLDASGNFLWVKTFGGSTFDWGQSITVDTSGNLFTTGYFTGTLDFDPGAGTAYLTSTGSIDNDVFVQKLDSSGNFLWAKSFGGSFDDWVQTIMVDDSGSVYVAGSFQGTVDFDPGAGTANHTSLGGWDIFIQKLDSYGNFLWAKTFGGILSDLGRSMTVDAFGNVYTTGLFEGTVDFDPGSGTANRTSAGDSDAFIQKIGQCAPNTGTDVITACDSFTWIDGITYTASNNTATDTLTNAASCDSVVTLNLTIKYSTYSTDVVSACDAYTWVDGITYTANNNTATDTLMNAAGCDSVITLNLTINTVSDITTSTSGLTITANNASATYQWLDCSNNYAIITGETGQSFTATVNGNYAVELTENGCVDTSACVAVTTVGILENTFGHSVAVYPNPTNGAVSINLGKNYESVTIIIKNLLGQDVLKKSFTSSNVLQLIIPGEAGMYFIEVNCEDKKAIVKVMKE